VKLLLLLGMIVTYPFNLTADQTSIPKEILFKLEPTKKKFVLGEAVTFNFSVRNNSTKPIILIQVLNGSQRGLRWPMATLNAFDHKGRSIGNKFKRRCKNLDPFSPSDIIEIQSGKEFKAAQNGLFIFGENFSKAGKYKVKFNYSTIEDDFKKYSGNSMSKESYEKLVKECGKLFKERLKVNFKTEIDIEIIPKN